MKEDLAKIVSICSCYQVGESFNLKHVKKWIRQFKEGDRAEIAKSTAFALEKTYIPKMEFTSWLVRASKRHRFNIEAKRFWKEAKLIKQSRGKSQRDLLKIFRKETEYKLGSKIDKSVKNSKVLNFVYIDDVIFSGNTALSDIKKWFDKYYKYLKNHEVNILILVYRNHTSGGLYLMKKLKAHFLDQNCVVDIRISAFQKYRTTTDRPEDSDVLWLKESCLNKEFKMYWKNDLEGDRRLVFRKASGVGRRKIFLSKRSRSAYEVLMLKYGLKILRGKDYDAEFKPLGFNRLFSFGFGALTVSYRNCPNNCPLVFWADDGWYPLFPRLKRNSKMKRSASKGGDLIDCSDGF